MKCCAQMCILGYAKDIRNKLVGKSPAKATSFYLHSKQHISKPLLSVTFYHWQGQFSLNSVVVGPRATLRRFSRVCNCKLQFVLLICAVWKVALQTCCCLLEAPACLLAKAWIQLQVLSGAAVMPGGTLLEHTLVLSGDIVDAYSTWQASILWSVGSLPLFCWTVVENWQHKDGPWPSDLIQCMLGFGDYGEC